MLLIPCTDGVQLIILLLLLLLLYILLYNFVLAQLNVLLPNRITAHHSKLRFDI
jgi:hypothetical protein